MFRQGHAVTIFVLLALPPALAGCDSGAAPVRPRSKADATHTSGENTEGPLTVLAAASTVGALEEIAEIFQREHGANVQLSSGPSNALASQILAGAPADVYLSANVRWADAVQEQGLAEKTRPLLSNKLVLIVPEGNPAGIRTPADLLTSRLKKLAVAGENVPAGLYAEQALRSLDLYEPLVERYKIARGHDVRVTLSYVERGEADAGIVYATDALISKRVDAVYVFPPSSYEKIVYPVVLLRQDPPNPAARKFYEYLLSGTARQVFHQFGFTVVDGSDNARRTP